MRWIDRFSSFFKRMAIPNLTLFIVGGSGTFFLLGSFNPEILQTITLVPSKVFEGEIWRIFSFLFYPLDVHPIFAFFTYYLFYIMGTALEAEWGEAKFNLYIFLGVFWTVLGAFILPASMTVNHFLYGSVFLAFAYLYPDFELYLFFVIPVKIKYLAGFMGCLYFLAFILGPLSEKISILMSVLNFFCFFGVSIYRSIRGNVRPAVFKPKPEEKEAETAFHRCHICGITEFSDPEMDFRVCLECQGGLEYCRGHLKVHPHNR